VSLPPVFICSFVKKGSLGASTVKIAPPPRSYFLPVCAFSYCAPFSFKAASYSSKKPVMVFPFFFGGGGGGGGSLDPLRLLFAAGGGTGVERSTPLSITVFTLIPLSTSSAPPM